MRYSKKRVKRKGAIWPLLLGFLVLMMACLALAVDSALLWQARQELQVAADSSALGAVLELADDQLLIKRDGQMSQIVQRSFRVADHLAGKHAVMGQPLKLEIDDVNNLDVVAGFFDTAAPGLQPASPGDWDSLFINAIEVTARRTRERGTPVGLFFTRLFRLDSADVTASSTALLDRHIIGFRPSGQLTVPMMPIALLSDSSGINENSWESQIDKPLSTDSGGLDQYVFHKNNRQWKQVTDGSRGDGLPEFTLRLRLSGEGEDANGCLLQIGKNDGTTLIRQMETGLNTIDLQGMDGQFTLGWDGMLPVEESEPPSSRTLGLIVEQLKTLVNTGEARIWPLYIPGEVPDSPQAQAGALVRGFVAARVAHVEQTDEYLLVTLQPTILTTATALIEPGVAANSYVGKIRLVR